MKVSVVVPTLGRSSLTAVLERVPAGPDREVLVVDDRPDRTEPLAVPPGVRVVAGPARGPAAARNTGWHSARHEWIAFLDDDVLPDRDWPQRLAADLAAAGDQVGGVQGVLRVPLPPDRPPTDWERVTAGLADGEWITADMAYRRAVLERAGGFDERLPRAFREDAELAFRVRRDGWSLCRGLRTAVHPVRPESPWVSLRSQRGNADDALLRRLYGPHWRERLEIPPGRRGRHTATTAAGLTAAALGLIAACSRRPAWTVAAGVAAAVWVAGTAEFAAARILPGPRDGREVTTMLATSVAIPPFAVAHWLRGWWRWRDARPVAAAPSSERTAIGTARPEEKRPAGGGAEPRWQCPTGPTAGPVRESGSAVGGTVRSATRPARTAR